jgi:arylsulfatase A-like enzyme
LACNKGGPPRGALLHGRCSGALGVTPLGRLAVDAAMGPRPATERVDARPPSVPAVQRSTRCNLDRCTGCTARFRQGDTTSGRCRRLESTDLFGGRGSSRSAEVPGSQSDGDYRLTPLARRRFGYAAVALVATLAACTASGASKPNIRVGERHPNVLIIVTDDQRASGTLQVMAETRRWFAENGTRFTRAFATTPLCCPFRASLFTGRYAHNHGVVRNLAVQALDHRSTLQYYLRTAGYNTAIVGKFLNRWPLEEAPPYFDRYSVFLPEHSTHGYYDVNFNVDGEIDRIDEYSTDFIADESVRILEDFDEDDSRPWLLYVTPYAPHGPRTPEPAYEEAWVPTWDPNPAVDEKLLGDKPDVFSVHSRVIHDNAEQARTQQLRTLMSVDDLVGRLAGTLDRLREERDTIAFFMSDSGFLWGEHNLLKKRLPYTQAVRIPLLVRWVDGRHEPVDDRLVGGIDVAPTVLEATTTAPDPAYPLDGRPLDGRKRRRLLLEHWSDRMQYTPTWASLVSDDYQYTEYYFRGGNRKRAVELYDLKADPWELENLASSQPESRGVSSARLGRLSHRLDRYRNCVGAGCP